ncbi:MAG: UDP-N-acetylmuramoyl-tripeptide--D-alanyl-D-alanine ligase [Ardenticatenaceae bacterium]
MVTFTQVYTGLTGRPAPSAEATTAGPITPWVMNSKLVQPGGGFLARPGASEDSPDGHSFIGDALRRGASVVIAERARTNLASSSASEHGIKAQVIDLAAPKVSKLKPPLLFLTDDSLAAVQKLATWWRNQANPELNVIGITGSVGKTTVKELTTLVLSTSFKTWKSRGNYNSDIGLPLTLLDMPLDMQQAVLEMGMTRSGEISELTAIARPQIGVVTNVGVSHMEQLGNIEAIANAKAELVANLPADGVAILNGDDERVRAMASQTQAKVFTYGLQPQFTLWADQIQSLGLNGIAFRFHHGNDRVFAKLPLLGRHSVHAALAAASVGLCQGMSWAEIITGLKDLARMEVLRIVIEEGINGSKLIDDSYNASPDSVMAALNLLSDLDGRRIAVLGDMLELGEYTEQGHKLVARRAANVASLFVAIGEMSELMAQEAQIAGLPSEAIFATTSRDDATDWLEKRLQPDDIVLVKASRGLRLDQMVTHLARKI